MSESEARLSPRSMAGWFNREPESEASGERTNCSAALWRFECTDPLEISSPADTETHILCLQTTKFKHDTYVDEKLVYPAHAYAGSASLVIAGGLPRSILYDRFGCLHLYIPCRAVSRLSGELDAGDAKSVELVDPKLAHDPVLADLGRGLGRAMCESDSLSRLAFDSFAELMGVQLLRRWSNRQQALERHSTASCSLAPWQLRRSVARLADQLAEDISLADLAATARLSPFHFARAFKASTGLPPHRYQMQLRLDRARELLETTDLPVIDVAASVGYDDPGYFARLFSRAYSLTPSRYRRERRA